MGAESFHQKTKMGRRTEETIINTDKSVHILPWPPSSGEGDEGEREGNRIFPLLFIFLVREDDICGR